MGFTVLPVRPGALLSDDEFQRIVGGFIRSLEEVGARLGTPEDLTRPEPLVYLVATGGTEQEILKLDAARHQVFPDAPVLLVAHPSANSLPAALEVLARLRQDGRRGRIFYLEGPDDSGGLEQIAEAVRDLEVAIVLKEKRIGLIGRPSDWLVASRPDPSIVRQTWGPRVLPMKMEELTAGLRSIQPEMVTRVVDSLSADAGEVVEPTPSEQHDVARVHLALKELVERHALDALSIRCFDLVLDQRTTGCLALARLNDQHVIAGCEGDLVSTVAMMWAHEMVGEIPWMANPAQLDENRNTLWLAHCTVPLSLVTGYTLRSHFESGLGVAVQGTLPEQPVTLIRIGGAGMDELWLAEGDIIGTGDSEDLCRTQVEILITEGQVRDLLRSPLGNHLVMVRGHHASRLRSWWETMIAPRQA